MASSVAAPMPMTASRPRAAYTKVQVTGLVLMATAPLLTLVIGLATGMTLEGEGMFLAVAVVVPLIGAAVAWRFGLAGKIVGLVAAVLTALGTFWLAFGLMAPASFGDFVPAVLMAVGVVLAVGWGIAATRAQVKHRHEEAPAEGRVRTIAFAIVALAVLASAVLSFTSRATVDAAAAAGAVPVTQKTFEFSQATYEVPAGQPATVLVHNSDGFVHDFAVPALGIEPQTILPGSEKLIEIGAADAGEYSIFCTLHSDTSDDTHSADDMAATLVVK